VPAVPPPISDDRSGLFVFLAQQRELVRTMAFGLTDEQSRSTPSASSLSIGGVLKHLAMTERTWTARATGTPMPRDQDRYLAGFVMGPADTLTQLLDDYAAACQDTDAALGELDLEQPVPTGEPQWYPKEWAAWSVRWVLLHLIEETARHCGQMDVIRESIDGATWFELLAAVEGPPAPWVTPWTPGAAPAVSSAHPSG
jgi:uncharacterized damage-inducible protein DinB